ncbi:MAG: hypothetical protein KBC38_01380 [Candidatus Pacebacteria bacterium]|nr:hypothetical protein [Candidatus Paceibacterota bacterium]MBP9840287.1 hypothetical protein [Candidatus Paceibacterota bacterium]
MQGNEEEPVIVATVDEGKEELEKLTEISNELEEIKHKVAPTRWRVLRNGLYQGAGVVLGGAIAVVLIGWLLAFLGVIPGFHDTAEYLRGIVETRR